MPAGATLPFEHQQPSPKPLLISTSEVSPWTGPRQTWSSCPFPRQYPTSPALPVLPSPRPFPHPGSGQPLPVPCPPSQPLLRLPCPPPGVSLWAGAAPEVGGRTLQLRPPGIHRGRSRCWRRGRPDVRLAAPRGTGVLLPAWPGRIQSSAKGEGLGESEASAGSDAARPLSCPAFQEKRPGAGRAGAGLAAGNSGSQQPGQPRKNRKSREAFRRTNFPLIAACNRGLFLFAHTPTAVVFSTKMITLGRHSCNLAGI